jgi:hypothetical protein
MMKHLADYLTCVYRPETDTMVCRWMREVSPAEMRRSYEDLFLEAQRIGSHRWLLDIRRRNNEDPETAQWLLDQFMPKLAAYFSGPTFLAYLLSPIHLVRVDEQAIDIVQVTQLQRSVHVALFTDEGSASNWLLQQIGRQTRS